MSYGNIIYANTIDQVPKEECFAILKNGQQYEAPYDKGDPGGYRPILQVEFVKDEKSLIQELQSLDTGKEKYTVVKIIPVEIQIERKINIGIKK